MTAVITTPEFTDAVVVIADAVLARGSVLRGTIDLRQKFGADLYFHMARGGTAALSSGIDMRIRRQINNGVGSFGRQPSSGPAPKSTTAAAVVNTTCNVTSNAGDVELKLASITGITVGMLLAIWDNGNTTFNRLEFGVVSKLSVASGTGVTLDAPLLFTHTSGTPDTVRDASDCIGPIWVPGGSLIEVELDYGSQTTGDSAGVGVIAQVYADNSNV